MAAFWLKGCGSHVKIKGLGETGEGGGGGREKGAGSREEAMPQTRS
jgi:hypothetical protein